MSGDPLLTVWVIYYGASNHPPGKWVLRPQDAMRDGTIRPHEVFHECNSLAEARAMVPEGCVCLQRMPEDDPVIVETWI